MRPWASLSRRSPHYPGSIDVIEDGDSFAANAKKKACEQARHLGQWVLGEDSGICVDALEGRPGIYSARFAGPDATDPENNQLLLDKLRSLPIEQRTAHYSCHMALSDPLGNICAESESHCCGRIRYEEAGNHGFGYDPLFEIIEYHRTFGELGPAMKAAISHRARAMALLLPQLHKIVTRWNRQSMIRPNRKSRLLKRVWLAGYLMTMAAILCGMISLRNKQLDGNHSASTQADWQQWAQRSGKAVGWGGTRTAPCPENPRSPDHGFIL